MPTSASLAAPSAAGLLCAAALALAPAAHAAGAVKVPAPGPGEVAVAIAPVSGAGKLVAPKSAPAGGLVTGGLAGAGAKKVAVVAVIRPNGAGAGKVSVKISGRGRVAAGGAAASALSGALPAALATAAKPACATLAGPLGHVLRRSGEDAPTAADARKLGAVLAARLCGKDVGDQGATLVKLLGLTFSPVGAPSASLDGPTAAAGTSGSPSAAAASAIPAPATQITPQPDPKPDPQPDPKPDPKPVPDTTPACSNGKDDDGDGQIDALGKGAQFFDPGCNAATDTSEDSEKATPRACGIGITTKDTRRGWSVDFDSLSFDDCPKQMSKGIVDLASDITDCLSVGWEGGAGNASCDTKNGVVTVGAGQGDQWQASGLAKADLCDTKGYIVGYTADGQAWEQGMTVFDGAEACKTLPPPNATQCNDGLDNDFDGQVDMGGVGTTGPDPGCDSPTDSTEGTEQPFDSWGCHPVVAPSPTDDTIAWVYLIKGSGFGDSCPTIDAVWLSFMDQQVTACDDGPYWDGSAAGTCVVQGGDSKVSGGSGQRVAFAVKTTKKITCDTDGQIDIRVAGKLHEAIFENGTVDPQTGTLSLCP